MIFLIILLLFYALFSACEISFVACDRIKIRKRGKTFASVLIENPTRFLLPILCGVNLATVAFGAIAAKLWRDRLPEILIVIIATFIILLFGEILPKTLAQRFKERIVISFARFVSFLYWLFFAPLFLVRISYTGILKLLKVSLKDDEVKFGKEEIYYASREALTAKETDVITRLLEFGDKRVEEVMIPASKIWTASIDSTPEDIVDIIAKSGHSRIPIFSKTRDDIAGIVYIRDLMPYLLLNKKIKNIKEVMRPCIFVPEQKRISTLFTEMRKGFKHLAIVKNEYGGTSGLVTLEDILEELFGEIRDEYDTNE